MENVVNKPLGKVLEQAGLISDLHIRAALDIQSKNNQVKFGKILVSQGIVKQKTVDFFADQFPKLLQQSETQPLGYYLQEASLINSEQIEILLEEQKQTKLFLGELIIEKGWLTKKTINFFLKYLVLNKKSVKLLSPSQQEIIKSLNLEAKAASPYYLLKEVFKWTGGHPLLTREICQIIANYKQFIPQGLEAKFVEKVVRNNVINNWETQQLGGYLKTIEYYLLNNTTCPPKSLLRLYLQILQQGEVSSNQSLEQQELINLGLVTEKDNKLTLSNRLYSSIFSLDWVKKKLSGLKPQLPATSHQNTTIVANNKKVLTSNALTNKPLLWAILLGFLLFTPLVIFFRDSQYRLASENNSLNEDVTPENNSLNENVTPENNSLNEDFAVQTTAATNSNAIEDVNRLSNGTINVLGNTFSGYATLRSTAFQDALNKSGITMQYGNEFVQAELAEALNQGKADVILTTLDQFLLHKPQGKIVALIDRTVGADAIVLNTNEYPQLNSLIDLENLVKQKQSQGQRLKIIFAGDTPSEFLATVLDAKFDNFDLADFEVIRVDDATTAWAQMQAPQSNIALAVLWEPMIAAARQEGNTVLLSSADSPKIIVDLAVASDSILESNPQLVQKFVENYYRQIDSSVQNRATLLSQIAADGDLTELEAAAVFKGIHFFTSVEAQDWVKSGTLDKRIGSLAGILALSGLLEEIPPDFKALYHADFINSAATKTNKLIEIIGQDNPELAMRLKGASLEASPSNTKNSQVQVKQGADIGNITVEGEVQFAFGSAMLTEEGKRTLDKLATDIGEFNPNTIAIKVQGHTSKTGSADLNQKLSQERANVVASYLKQKNLSHKFLAEGLGFSQPLPGVDPSSSLNQRTVIRLVRIGSET